MIVYLHPTYESSNRYEDPNAFSAAYILKVWAEPDTACAFNDDGNSVCYAQDDGNLFAISCAKLATSANPLVAYALIH